MLDPNPNHNNIRPDKSSLELGKAVNLTSTITINYLPPGPDPYWIGDNCIVWPAAAQAAFEAAVNLWTSKLTSAVPIAIDACWADNMPSTPEGTVLSHSGPIYLALEEVSGTLYPIALANALTEIRLNPGESDIYIGYNGLVSWYFGTDGNPPSSQVDFVSAVAHEIAHGLGFLGSMGVGSGQGFWGLEGYPFIYDRYAVDGAGYSLLDTNIYPNPSVALGNTLTGGAVFFNGSNASTANGGSPVKLYAPSNWASGSSYSHLDYATYVNSPNALMVPYLSRGRAIHDQGPVTLGLLKDLGWGILSDNTPPTVTSTAPTSGATGVAVSSAVTATFSETMDFSTISTDTFTLSGSTPVTGTVNYDSVTRTATFTPSATLDGSTFYTATITTGVKDMAGNPLAAPYSWSFITQPTQQTLAVTISGSGTGTVTSSPAGISCTTGTCSAPFAAGSSVTLMATPSSNSLFNGWSGSCTNTAGDCVLTMDTAKYVTASFVILPPVRIAAPPGSYYWFLADAVSVVPTGETIQTQATILTENVALRRAVSVFINGGYDSSYSSVIGRTILHGKLAISQGRLTVKNLAIR